MLKRFIRTCHHAALTIASLLSPFGLISARHGAWNICPETTPFNVPTLTTIHKATTQRAIIYDRR